MERPVVRVLDWRLTWEDPAHIEQGAPCSAGPECYWKATRGNPGSHTPSWPLFQFLPPGLLPEFLSWLKDGFRSCKMKSTLSSFSCLWPWCFIPVIETLRWHRSVKLRNHLPSPSGSLAGRKQVFKADFHSTQQYGRAGLKQEHVTDITWLWKHNRGRTTDTC